MKTKKRAFPVKSLLALLAIALSLTLTFCFSDEDTTTTTTTTTTTGVPAAGSLSLRISQTTVKSDNSDSATITATVLDANNAVIEGATVAFSSTGGQFNASSSVTTDSGGEAAIGFSAGPQRSNQTVTITATISGLSPKTVPIQITGSTITLTAGNTNLEANDTDTLTIAVKDAGSLPISDTSVTASVDTSSTGTATVSPSTGTTDTNGELDVTLTGTGAGSVTVRIQAAGVTATQDYTISATGNAFGISSPTTDPYSLNTDTDLTITVNAPNQTSVQFATTLGTWDGGDEMVVTKDVNTTTNTVSAILNSANAGVATVQVIDADDTATTDSLKVAISAPSSEATQIALQASATVVAPSIGSTSNSVTLEATVNNANEEPVGSSPVAFSIANPTGGGESISPVVAFTDSFGEATSTFTSGSLSSDAQGVTVYANVVVSNPGSVTSDQIAFNDDNPDTITRADGGDFTQTFSDGDQIKVSGSTGNNGFYTIEDATAATLTLVASDTLTDENAGASVTITYAIWDSIPIVIGGTAGSVMIGIGTTVESINDDTTYRAPMSVVVADSNGNPVHGATVSLSAWPLYYSTGCWLEDPETGECAPGDCDVAGPFYLAFANEDTNRNLIKDPGEDVNGDGELTPPSSAVGTVDSTVTTDENGVASYDLVYVKSSANWIMAEITASTLVLGTETQSTYTFWLGWLEGEECSLPHSPFN
jgi:hypothetical protein